MNLNAFIRTFGLALLLMVLSSLPICAYATKIGPKCNELLLGIDVKKSEAADMKFVEQIKANPANMYTYLRTRAKAELEENLDGESDFKFPEAGPAVEQIIAQITKQLKTTIGRKFSNELKAARTEALELLKENTPYKKTVRFIMYRALPSLDLILFERHPKLKDNKFHETNARHLIEPYLQSAPDMIFYFSTAWVDDSFFVDTRPALMNIIGINFTGLNKGEKPPYADKFSMSLTEFAYHDIGHAEFTSARDLQYLSRGEKKIDSVVWEWQITAQRMRSVINEVMPKDADLGEAMDTLLFEMLRERGFQFSLTVLKQELETDKWVSVLIKKFKSGFFEYYGTNAAKFARLSEAREVLLKAAEGYKEEDQIQWAKTLRSHIVPSRITYTPRLHFFSGTLERINIYRDGTVKVQLQASSGEAHEVEIRELVSAQVDPTKNSPLNAATIKKITKDLSAMHATSVSIEKDGRLRVNNNGGSRAKAADLKDIQVFEINQVLGSNERNEAIQYTVRAPIRILQGTIRLERDSVSGSHTAHITTLAGENISVPLAQIRIDPL